MTVHKENVFVLTKVPYRDSDLVTNFLSYEFGKLSAVVFGGRKIGKASSFPYNSGDLLTIEFNKNEAKDFIKINQISPVKLLKPDQYSYDQYVIHAFIIELINKVSKPSLPSEDSFNLLFSKLNHFQQKSNEFTFLLWSLWTLIKSGGYQIDYSSCETCKRNSWQLSQADLPVFRKQRYRLNLESGMLVCADCQKVDSQVSGFNAAMVKILWIFDRTSDYEESLFKDFPQDTVISMIRQIIPYLNHCFDFSLKSQESLDATLAKKGLKPLE